MDAQLRIESAKFDYDHRGLGARVVLEGYASDGSLHRRLRNDGLPVGIVIVPIANISGHPRWRRALHRLGCRIEMLAKHLQC